MRGKASPKAIVISPHKKQTIQYVYRKGGTNAQVLSPRLHMGTAKKNRTRTGRNKVSTVGSDKGKVFYGQEPPSGESTTTECGFNYQLLAVIY